LFRDAWTGTGQCWSSHGSDCYQQVQMQGEHGCMLSNCSHLLHDQSENIPAHGYNQVPGRCLTQPSGASKHIRLPRTLDAPRAGEIDTSSFTG
jgi:hypothetical protein